MRKIKNVFKTIGRFYVNNLISIYKKPLEYGVNPFI